MDGHANICNSITEAHIIIYTYTVFVHNFIYSFSHTYMLTKDPQNKRNVINELLPSHMFYQALSRLPKPSKVWFSVSRHSLIKCTLGE